MAQGLSFTEEVERASQNLRPGTRKALLKGLCDADVRRNFLEEKIVSHHDRGAGGRKLRTFAERPFSGGNDFAGCGVRWTPLSRQKIKIF
jgi:hypothetical protein